MSTKEIFNKRFRVLVDRAVNCQKKSKRKQAREIGILPSTFFSYYDNRTMPGSEKITKIAYYYGVTTDYLLGLEVE